MVNTIIYDDEIVLYWDKQWEYPDGIRYRVRCNEQTVATEKTHFSWKNLSANTAYAVAVERLNEQDDCVEILFSKQVCTIAKKNRIDVTKAPYFAKGDGKTLNTKAIQQAFDDCTARESVYFPKGVYLTGALNMHGDMELYVDKGAVLQGTTNVDDFKPKRLSRFEGIERLCYSALLNIGVMNSEEGCTVGNIVVRGGGCIIGGGKELAENQIAAEQKYLQQYIEKNQEYVRTCENDRTIPGRTRSRLIAIYNAKNVVLSNVTLGYAAAWNVHMVYSKNIITHACTIRSDGVWNGDGWNPDSSENCTIFDCTLCTGDDAIAIKSGKNPEGNIINRPTKGIRVFDCRGKNGIAVGSEMSGGVKDVFVWDCDFLNSYAGLTIKSTEKRGGYIKNIRVKNCSFADVSIQTKLAYNNDGKGCLVLPSIEDIRFENLEIKGVSLETTGEQISVLPIRIEGFDKENHYLNDIRFQNVRIHKRADGKEQNIAIKNVKNVSLQDISFL